MPKTCVVPNCNSNYRSVIKTEGYVTVFRFPTDPALRDQWTRAIPRADWQPTNYSYVCIKHFLPDDISSYEKYKDGDGNWKEFPRKSPVLCPGAIPKVFPNLPAYLSKQHVKKRKSPEERKEEEEKRRRSATENERRAAEEANTVGTFERLVTHVQEKVNDCKKDWSVSTGENHCILYRLELSNIPKISSSIRINKDLSVEIHINGGKIPNSEVISNGTLIFQTSTLRKWNQIAEAIEFCNNFYSQKDCISQLTILINSLMNNLTSELENKHDESSERILKKLEFLHDQFTILFLKKPRYTTHTILNAFLIYMQSVKCYSVMRFNNILSLPHPRVLQRLSSSLAVSPNTDQENANFLRKIVKDLSEIEKFVNIQIDEIHVKQALDFKSGNLLGAAANESGDLAKTVVAFLISSAFGNFKEVVKLVPVLKLKGLQLAEFTKEVIQMVRGCGLNILSIISDNNGVNRTMFNDLTKGSDSKYCFQIEGNPIKTFVLYDSVHILKNIRNN